MRIVYYSFTNNTKAFVEKYFEDYDPMSIEEGSANCPYLLITPTYDFGQIPAVVEEWLEDNHQHMVGVVSNGNRNWGDMYARAGDLISDSYNVPLILKIELRGNEEDSKIIKEWIKEIEDEDYE